MEIAIFLVGTVVLISALAWIGGFVGHSSVLPLREADATLSRIAADLAAEDPDDVVGPSETATHEHDAEEPARAPFGGAVGSGPESTARNRALLDAAIPGAVAFAGGTIDWLTPDGAAVAALSQATQTEISNAFDFHRTLAQGDYQLLAEASLTKWSGHVAEAQVAEQIDSWAGADTARLAENSNFAGADVSFFDHDYQVKFYSDFRDIDNLHGDTLIVNEDAANIPSDALHIDLSVPFDPAILEVHDVIVAEGLTLAGADNAWESGAGLWAGGLDAGDALDAASASLIPGVGAAIRVGMSGYKRRAALQDPDLRARASGRVAQDAVRGVAGTSGWGFAGMLLGGLLDVATLGGTLGVGATLGSALGAGYGGKRAGDASRAADRKAVEEARTRAAEAVAAYGVAVDMAQLQAEMNYREVVSRTEADAARLATVRLAQSRHAEKLATVDLALLRTMGVEEADDLIKNATARISIAEKTQRSPRARRLRIAWMERDRRLKEARNHGATADVREVLTLVAGSPNGAHEVRSWLRDRVARRAVTLAAAETLMTAIHRQALADRMQLAASLADHRRGIQEKAAATLTAPIHAVEQENCNVKKELVIAGYLTPAEADRLSR